VIFALVEKVFVDKEKLIKIKRYLKKAWDAVSGTLMEKSTINGGESLAEVKISLQLFLKIYDLYINWYEPSLHIAINIRQIFICHEKRYESFWKAKDIKDRR
jgi:hypothetical protein